MKITVGYYKCRNGSKARVLCTDAPGDYPVVGYYETGSGVPSPQQWAANGSYWNYGAPEHLDLIEPWREPVRVSGWVNVWGGDRISSMFSTKSQAEAEAREVSADLGHGPIACVYVTGLEGVGPTDPAGVEGTEPPHQRPTVGTEGVEPGGGE